MKYVSDDGRIFDSEQDCVNYEKELRIAKERENKLVEEKQKRYEEMISKVKEVQDCINTYNKDYNARYEPVFNPISDLVKYLIG